MKRNYPFIIITALAIIMTLVFVYLFTYQSAINTVRSAVLIEKAYPKIKPEEYINQLKIEAQKNKLQLTEIRKEKNIYLIQILNPELLDKLLAAPSVAVLSIINIAVYDIGDGTAVVGNNPYLWDIISPSNYIDDLAESYSDRLSEIFDNVYWEIKKKKKILK